MTQYTTTKLIKIINKQNEENQKLKNKIQTYQKIIKIQETIRQKRR